MKYLKPLFYLFAAVLIISCEKDEDEVVSKEKLITGKSWKLIAASVDPPVPDGNSPISDIYANLPSCSKDNFMTFNINGTLLFDEGPTKCTPADPQTESGEWFFNSDKSVVIIEQNTETVSYTIIKLSPTELKISFKDTVDDSDDIYTITLSYSAQ